MGMMDKMKFWKRDDDFGDLGSLDDFSLDEPGAAPGTSAGTRGGGIPPDADADAMGELPTLDEPTVPGMETGVPTRIEELQPSEASRQIGEQLGIHPETAPTRQYGTAPSGSAYPSPQYTATPPRGSLADVAKDIEIMHAKIDAIRSSLESINQRLASLERMASGPEQKRYTW